MSLNIEAIMHDRCPRLSMRSAQVKDAAALETYFQDDPWTNMFIQVRVASFLSRTTFNDPRVFILIAEEKSLGEKKICGVCMVTNKLAMPVTSMPEVARRFGHELRMRELNLAHIIGEDQATLETWKAYSARRTARLNRLQRYYVLDHDSALPTHPTVPLRKARMIDYEALTLASSAMHLEETYIDPLLTNPDSFRLIVRQRVLDGRAFVWVDPEDETIIFKVDISCVGNQGVLLSGVYTDPNYRRQGRASCAMGQLCKGLLRVFPSIMLYVNDNNETAVNLYERLGFRLHSGYRTVFVDHDA